MVVKTAQFLAQETRMARYARDMESAISLVNVFAPLVLLALDAKQDALAQQRLQLHHAMKMENALLTLLLIVHSVIATKASLGPPAS